MSTAFELDLNNNTFKLGSTADGPVEALAGELSFIQPGGLSGKVTGNFTGEIKGGLVLPMTEAHQPKEYGGYNIIVIGAGGTGGYVVRDLTRFVYALKEKGLTKPISIKLVDGDKVEAKNVLRQNFTARDEGKYKAEVLARRYSSAFGVEVTAVTEMLGDCNLRSLYDTRSLRNGSICNIVVGCVDNNEARRTISRGLDNTTYWIDSGNERKSGQVVCGYKDRYNSSHDASRLPFVTDYYPEINDPEEDELEAAESCAERAAQETQNIFINMTAAGHVLSYIRQILMEEPVTITKIEFNTKGVTNVEYRTRAHIDSLFPAPRF